MRTASPLLEAAEPRWPAEIPNLAGPRADLPARPPATSAPPILARRPCAHSRHILVRRVEAVQQALVALTGVPLGDQVVICEGVRLDPHKPLSVYGLPVVRRCPQL